MINKIQYLSNLMFLNGLHFLTVTETWLSEEVGSSFVDVPGFKFFRSDSPSGVRKHGVGVYVSDLLSAVPVGVGVDNVVVLFLSGLGLHVVSVYRPPSNSAEDNELLLAFLSEFCFGRSVLLVGDFILPSLKWSPDGLGEGYVSPLDRSFYEVFSIVGLSQWVYEPTFLQSGNILDLVLSSSPDAVCDLQTLPPMPGCQHIPVVFSYLAMESECAIRGEVSKYLWYKGDYSSMNEELAVVDWDSMFSNRTVEDCYSLFCSTISRLVQLYVPLVEQRPPRWQLPPPRALIRSRAAAWAEYKSKRVSLGRKHSSTEEALEIYLAINRSYRAHSRDSQCKYECELAKKLKSSPKLFHSYIRRKKKGCSAVGPLKVGQDVLVEPGQIAEAFADYFGDLFSSDCQTSFFCYFRESYGCCGGFL